MSKECAFVNNRGRLAGQKCTRTQTAGGFCDVHQYNRWARASEHPKKRPSTVPVADAEITQSMRRVGAATVQYTLSLNTSDTATLQNISEITGVNIGTIVNNIVTRALNKH